ncbi:sensor histidine kinase [Allosphingosinicella indica]|uniref:Histidine kinase n=1 Tax=Allosphingosinicella indica TaxID=941907 RepID=A0A1X7GIC7_9SPHN|nr:histidine kinase [Allosphingosinicella indica]SMF70257.1 Histidine kinase [Allosphingosinicella indica]
MSEALRPALVIWAFGYLLVEIFATLQGRASTPGVMLVSSVPLFALGVLYTLLLDRLRRNLGALPRLLRWPALLAAVAVVTVVHALTDVYWLRWLALHAFPEWQEWALNLGLQRLFTIILLYLWTFCLALTLLWAAGVGSAARASEKRAVEFEAASHRAEAAALRLQLNPHFLFNALNSISSLVTLDRKQDAEEMIGQLADFLRASLNSDPMADVPLGEELATVDAYLAVESARFGDRLAVDIDVPDELLAAAVPNFILQPLVENAIKHGVSVSRGGATIKICAEREGEALRLSVANHSRSGATPEPREEEPDWAPRRGIGIDNLRQRLAVSYGDAARLETEPLPDGYRAAILMPLRTA